MSIRVAIVVFVIGDKYINIFNGIFRKNLEEYCKKNKYDLILLHDLIRQEPNMDRKKFYWQRFLIPDKFKDYDYVISMDSDIFVNLDSPPIPFNEIPQGKICAVNERKYCNNYEWRENVQIKMGWEKTGKDWYALSGENKDYNDHINGGFVIYQPQYHAKIMLDLYNNNISRYQQYHQDDQSILSSYLIDNDLVYWLDERYNKIWFFWRETFYPNFQDLPRETQRLYIQNFLKLNYFTHFTSSIDVDLI
jgi:hypothetical protein